MKAMLAAAAFIMCFAGCASRPATEPLAASAHSAAAPTSIATTRPAAATVPATLHSVAVKSLTEEQQAHLLSARIPGGMGQSFRSLSNVFFVQSHIELGIGVGLMTSSSEVARSMLQSPFPKAYLPTLRELLDAIALQTFSEWKYDPTSHYVESTVDEDKPTEDLAIFEFKPIHRKKPFKIKLAEGWKSEDRGNWLMCSPAAFPVGMDVYEMGTYSSDDKTPANEFFMQIREQVALDWARRAKPDAKPADLKPAKVGRFEALYYESMVPSQLGKEIKWRQWVFMAGNQCYFVVSTILPELDKDIFPDVQKMLESFTVGS